MHSRTNNRFIDLLLLFLVLLDLVLSVVCLLSPSFWVQIMHGTSYNDTWGLVHRLGGVWLGFFVFQLIALLFWRKHSWLLVLVAGIRLTESFSDWIYWFTADQHTWFANVGLLIAPPANWLFAFVLIREFLRMNNHRSYSPEKE
jgi:hypothetical protein